MGGCRGAAKQGNGVQGRGIALEAAAAEPRVANFPNSWETGVKKKKKLKITSKRSKGLVVFSPAFPVPLVFFPWIYLVFMRQKWCFSWRKAAQGKYLRLGIGITGGVALSKSVT